MPRRPSRLDAQSPMNTKLLAFFVENKYSTQRPDRRVVTGPAGSPHPSRPGPVASPLISRTTTAAGTTMARCLMCPLATTPEPPPPLPSTTDRKQSGAQTLDWRPSVIGKSPYTDAQLQTILKDCGKAMSTPHSTHCAASAHGSAGSRTVTPTVAVYSLKTPEPGALEVVLGTIGRNCASPARTKPCRNRCSNSSPP